MQQFKNHLRQFIEFLNDLQDKDDYLEIQDYCKFFLRQCGDKAALLGLHQAVERCANAKPNLTDTRAAISFCLSLCKTPKKKSENLNVEQAANKLNLSKSKLYEDARNGILPHKRVGRRILITPEQFEAYQLNLDSPINFRHLS